MSDDNRVTLTGEQVAGMAAGAAVGFVSTAMICATGGLAAPLVVGNLLTVGTAAGAYAGKKSPGAAIFALFGAGRG